MASECRSLSSSTTTTAADAASSPNDQDEGKKEELSVKIVVCDLANTGDIASCFESSIDCVGGVDILVNNGGVSSRSSFLETGADVDERVMRINFLSGAVLAKMTVPGMVQRGCGGKVIWIGSVQGLLGIPNRSSYAASKFAVQGYCESLRAELASSGVTVHVVSPGYIRTNLSQSALKGDGTCYEKMDETTAKGADPEDVAVEILDRVAKGESDIIVAATFSAKVALWLKFLAPGVLKRILEKRYEKEQGGNSSP